VCVCVCVVAEAAEEKIERTPRDCVEAAGSSLKHSSNGGIVVGGSEAQQEQPLQLRSASFTLFTVASLQQHTGGFSRQDLVRETCFGKIYAADRPTGSKVGRRPSASYSASSFFIAIIPLVRVLRL
jgi:hypothetical protein